MDTQYVNVEIDELHPTYQTFARIIGLDAAIKLGQEFGGSDIYFPQLDALTGPRRAERDRKIVEDLHSGRYTKEQLARKYKMTMAGLGSVLKRIKAGSACSEGVEQQSDLIIEQIKQGLAALDEDGKRAVLKYAIKLRNSSSR